MTRDQKILAAAAAGAVLVWWFAGDDEEGGFLGDIRQAVNSAVNLVVKGNRLTHCPYDTTTGVVPCDPQALADQSGYDLETYSLARAIASEEARGSDVLKLAVGWAIRNRANAGAGSITALVTRAKYAPHSGLYGTQRNIEQGTPGWDTSDRYCASGWDPYDGDAQIAHGIQTGLFADITGGAQYFDRPAGDDNPEQTAANRLKDGLELAQIDGVPDSIRFWRPV